MEYERARAELVSDPVRPGETRPAVASPAAAALLGLQRAAGNRAVGRLLRETSGRWLARAEPDTATPAVPAPAPAPPAFTIPPADATLEVVSLGPTEYRAELRNYKDAYVVYEDNCAKAAFETFRKLTAKGLYSPKGKQPGLRTYDRTNPRSGRSGATDAVETDLNWNVDKVRETVAYIKGAIDRGLPVFVGVNEGGGGQSISPTTKLPINEGVTDHFLIIVGYTAENRPAGLWPIVAGGWRVTKLQAVDNAIDDPVRSFPTFDVTRDSIRKPANDVDHGWAADSEYQLTQVRVYADDVEQAKTASAWWN